MTKRAPNPSEVLSLLDHLVRFHFVARAAGLHILKQVNLNPGQRAILMDLGHSEVLTAVDMADARSISRQAVQKVVDALRDRGLVQTRRHPTDRRTKSIKLTGNGRAVLIALGRHEARIAARHCSRLDSADVAAAYRVLDILQACFKDEVPDLRSQIGRGRHTAAGDSQLMIESTRKPSLKKQSQSPQSF